MNFFLCSNKILSVDELENMFPWERDIYFNQYKNKLEEDAENARNRNVF